MQKPVYALEFEKPLLELTKELDSIHQKSLENNVNLSSEVRAMEKIMFLAAGRSKAATAA